MIYTRFHMYPSTFRASFLHPTESLFVPAATTSFGIILINITQYGVGTTVGGEWLERTMVILYWFYCAFAVVLSLSIYLILWSTQTFTISQMTPIWVFPAYPLLIVGPHAGNLAMKVSRENGEQIIIGGFIVQGIGFMVSLMIYSAFLYRLMSHKLPKESVRPGMFVSVGPSGFTISGLILMGQALPRVVSEDFMVPGQGQLVATITVVLANWAGLWLWGLAFWFFFISVGSHISSAAKGRIHFAMTW
jgi:tellurite resistance protein TehA-like permease